jgi:hypothetical protein
MPTPLPQNPPDAPQRSDAFVQKCKVLGSGESFIVTQAEFEAVNYLQLRTLCRAFQLLYELKDGNYVITKM